MSLREVGSAIQPDYTISGALLLPRSRLPRIPHEGFHSVVGCNKNTTTGKNRRLVTSYRTNQISRATSTVYDSSGVAIESVEAIITFSANAPNYCLCMTVRSCYHRRSHT